MHSTPHRPKAPSRPVFRWIVGCCVLAIAGLVGCATTNVGGDSVPVAQDIGTDSDRSPERKRAAIRLELALAYFQEGKNTIALDEVKMALATDPSYFDAYNLRGLIYMALNDQGLAQASFAKALGLRPKDPDVLHNLGWLKCQQNQFSQAIAHFAEALANPQYGARAKSLMTLGLCQIRAGLKPQAEANLLKAYEYDAGNPVTGFNLASLMFERGDLQRARFYIRRLNNSSFGNAESMWLGMRIEQRLGNTEAVSQLGLQLERRFADSPQTALWRRRAFDE